MTEPEIEPDPRTDGVGDGGKRELDPPSEDEIAAGVAYDREHRSRTIADPGTPFTENPEDDQYDEPAP